MVIFLLIFHISIFIMYVSSLLFKSLFFMTIYLNFGTLFQLIFPLDVGSIFPLFSSNFSFLDGYFKFIFISLQSIKLYLVLCKFFQFIFSPLFGSIFPLFFIEFQHFVWIFQVQFLNLYFPLKFIKFLVSCFNSIFHQLLILYFHSFHQIPNFQVDISSLFFILLYYVKLYLVIGKLFQLIFPPFFGSIFLLFLLNSNILGKYVKFIFQLPTSRLNLSNSW